MNPEEENKPVQGAAPTNPVPNTPTTPAGVGDVPQQDPSPQTTPNPSTTPAQAGPNVAPGAGSETPTSSLGDNTPDATQTTPTGAGGAYGQGDMQSQPEVPPTMPSSMSKKPMDKRKTGLILLLLIIVALAVVAWLLVQAFSG